MKGILLMIGVAAIGFASCRNAPEADKAVTTEAKQITKAEQGASYTTDNAQSTIQWIGTKPIAQHHGPFKIKEGKVMVSNNEITGGRFIIDAASLEAYDEDGKANSKLQNHLKSADFFDVAKYPEGRFEITQVQQGVTTTDSKDLVMKDATHTVTGNLTLKDQTKSISFPAKINISGNELLADADFNIDRTQWGIVYGNDKSLGDKFIRPEVNIKLHLVAKK